MVLWKLSIFVSAYRQRLSKQETLEEIHASYTKLSIEEKQEIAYTLNNQ